MVALLAACLAFFVSLVAPFAIKPLLLRLNVVDIPSARSSHSAPTIRGAGLATLAGLIAGCVALFVWERNSETWIVAVVLALSAAAAGVGWIEDYKGLSVRYRILCQVLIGTAATGIFAVLHGSHLWVVPIGGVLVASFINVANFMDGIDGISAFHGTAIGGMYALVGWFTGEFWMIGAGLVLSAVFLAFVPWNLGSGSIFLGDVGSYLLGGAVSAMAVAAVIAGVSPLMVIGPLTIYLADTAFTLISRILRGQRWYESHRIHIYHQLEDLGLGHVLVAAMVAGMSCATGALGLFAAKSEFWGAIFYASVAVVIVIAYLSSPRVIRRVRRRLIGGTIRENVDHG